LLAQIVGVNSWRRDEKRLKIERKEIEWNWKWNEPNREDICGHRVWRIQRLAIAELLFLFLFFFFRWVRRFWWVRRLQRKKKRIGDRVRSVCKRITRSLFLVIYFIFDKFNVRFSEEYWVRFFHGTYWNLICYT
jgi:hypothetical protein